MGDKLKPCPFCGGEAVLVKLPFSAVEYYGDCQNDGCPSDVLASKAKAAKAWNTRAGEE